MSEDRKNHIRECVDEVYNQGHLDRLEMDYEPDVVCHQSLHADLKGIKAMQAYILDLRNAYSDLKVTTDEIIVEGDTSMVRGYLQGTNTGESKSLKIPATGKQVRVPYCSVAHWKNGRVFEEFSYVDMLLLMHQLGLEPAAAF
jgi:predicted ester cyclase